MPDITSIPPRETPLDEPIHEGAPDTAPRHGDDEYALAAARRDRIRVKNRRKMYLDTHPSYFDSPDLEIVGMKLAPILPP